MQSVGDNQRILIMIETWEARINVINSIIEPLEAERGALEQKIIESKSAFKIGEIIEWRNGRRGRVVKIKKWVCGDPMWVVKRILKDGSEGEECEVRPYMIETKP